MNPSQGGLGVVWRQWRPRSGSWRQQPFPSDSNHVATSDNMDDLSRRTRYANTCTQKLVLYSNRLIWNQNNLKQSHSNSLSFYVWCDWIVACLKPAFHCFHGNSNQARHGGSLKKIATIFHWYFRMIHWQKIRIWGIKGAESPQFYIFVFPWQPFPIFLNFGESSSHWLCFLKISSF